MTSRIFSSFMLPLALLWAAPPQARAQPKPAQLVAAGSEIAFTTRQMGVPVEGRFGKFSAQIALDPRQPENGTVSITIDTGSARFGSAELDAEVPKPTWLNVPKFAQATFLSSAIKAAGAGKFEVTGKLSIKGSARDISVPVQLTQGSGGGAAPSTATGAFTIKRLEFKVGEDEWADTSMLANDIQVRFKLVLMGLAPL